MPAKGLTTYMRCRNSGRCCARFAVMTPIMLTTLRVTACLTTTLTVGCNESALLREPPSVAFQGDIQLAPRLHDAMALSADKTVADASPVVIQDAARSTPPDLAPTPTAPPILLNATIIDPEQNGETFLPGCAGQPTTPPNSCRGNGSLRDEVYAIRLDTSHLTDQTKLQQFPVRAITNDVMANEDPASRSFFMAVSTVAGDFSPRHTACSGTQASSDIVIFLTQSNADASTVATLEAAARQASEQAAANPNTMSLIDAAQQAQRQAREAKATLTAIGAGMLCLLDLSQNYFVNIRPAHPGCAYERTQPDGLGGIHSVWVTPNICQVEVASGLPKH